MMNRRAAARWTTLLAVSISSLHQGCGGGGGGGDGGTQPSLRVSPTSFTFSAVERGASPSPQTLRVRIDGGTQIPWNASADVPWVSLQGASGSGSGVVTLQVDSSGLVAGTHQGNVTVRATGASPASVVARVTLVLDPPPSLSVAPPTLTFDADEGGPSPAVQQLAVSSSGGSVTWSASEQEAWLSATPSAGSGAGSIDVSVDPAGLTPGTYSAVISVTASAAGNTPQDVAVQFVVHPPPTISVQDSRVTEGTGATTVLGFVVSLSASSSRTITVDYTTADSTAVAPGDYAPTSGSLTFSPGQTSATVDVDVVGDSTAERDETLELVLSGATAATIATSAAVGTIANDDVAPPVLTSSVGRVLHVPRRTTILFDISADHYQELDLRLINPPAGSSFVPSLGALGPITRSFRWVLLDFQGGRYSLHFEGRDSLQPSLVTRFTVEVHISTSNSLIHHGDVTGDGISDIIAAAPLADEADIDTGALYVWVGGGVPDGAPDFELTALDPGAKLGDDPLDLVLADLTDDGVQDILVVARQANSLRGAIHVWYGGPSLSRLPDIALTDSAAVPGSSFATATGRGVQVVDVTGDGVVDVIECARTTFTNAALMRVWRGGSALSAQPDFKLTAGGGLGFAAWLGVQLADVTGDGVADLLSGAQNDNGIYVWFGGASLSTAPDVVLTSSVAGLLAAGGYQAVDVTDDGVLDVVAGDPWSGANFTGAVFVWAGGPAIASQPTYALTVSGAARGDELSNGGTVVFSDVTGDGSLDVVAGTPRADVAGVRDAGALYVWRGGGALSSTPDVVLTVPGALPEDFLSLVPNNCGTGLLTGDVTGDGVLDVIAPSSFVDRGALADVGAVYVWAGGPSLSATLTATLAVAGSRAGDSLGNSNVQGVQLVDVTGDGVRDVIAATSLADVGGITDTGAVYLWAGVTFTFQLLSPSSPAAGDRLAHIGFGLAVQAEDLTGDGVDDVVAAGHLIDLGGVADVGAVYVWAGGAPVGSTPLVLAVPGAVFRDRLGGELGFALSQGILLRDVTGDGVLDLIGVTPHASSDVGAVYVWYGGATLSAAPIVTLRGPAVPFASLQTAGNHAVPVADVTGDGVLDVIVGASLADLTAADAGAIFFWEGGALGSSPDGTLSVPGASVDDRLGGN